MVVDEHDAFGCVVMLQTYLCGMASTPVPDDKPAVPPADPPSPEPLPPEVGGAPGPEPTRYGDWQHKGRVTDF